MKQLNQPRLSFLFLVIQFTRSVLFIIFFSSPPPPPLFLLLLLHLLLPEWQCRVRLLGCTMTTFGMWSDAPGGGRGSDWKLTYCTRTGGGCGNGGGLRGQMVGLGKEGMAKKSGRKWARVVLVLATVHVWRGQLRGAETTNT